MKINNDPNQKAFIDQVKYSSSVFTVDVESNGEKFPINIVFEYRTVLGVGSSIVRIDFTVALNTTWYECSSSTSLDSLLAEDILRVFPNEVGSQRELLLETLLEMVYNFQNNILNLKE
jgi:hypothetical protein